MTDLSKAVWATRRRLSLGTIDFGQRLGVVGPQISRYEAGNAVPDLKVLVRLLCLSSVPCERLAILRALHRAGIDEHLRSLRESGLLSDSSTSASLCEPLTLKSMSDFQPSSDIGEITP